MGKKLPPDQLELYRRCDEVLHYIWDSIGVEGAPSARDEYNSYVPQIFHLLVRGADKEAVIQALVEIQTEAMGLPGGRARADAAVDALLEWREWISEHGASSGMPNRGRSMENQAVVREQLL